MAQVYFPDEYAKIVYSNTAVKLSKFIKDLADEKFKQEGWKK